MGRICIFCQRQRKMSNEHIFPEWLQKYLNVQQEVLSVYLSNAEEPKRTMIYDKHRNGKVCEHCNSGWMSQIENRVKPILISMLNCASPIHITPDQGMTLAWWVYKTALTLHSASLYGSVIPQQHYELALHQIPPANFTIAIAYCTNKVEKPTWIQNQNWRGMPRFIQDADLKSQTKDTYRITLGFGNFVARVLYFPLRYRLFEFEQGAVWYIHPGNPDGFNWPLQSAIQNLHELDQSVVVSSDPEQDVEISKRLLELSLHNQIDDDHAQ